MVAYAELPGQQAQNQALLKSLTDQGLVRFNPPPTAEQWNAARAAARQIVLAAARPEPP
jgi:hypothetical protein